MEPSYNCLLKIKIIKKIKAVIVIVIAIVIIITTILKKNIIIIKVLPINHLTKKIIQGVLFHQIKKRETKLLKIATTELLFIIFSNYILVYIKINLYLLTN